MEETYKGCRIEYDQTLEKFTAWIGTDNYQNSSLSSVKKYIDRLDSKDFKRVDVIVEEYSKMVDAIVTSYLDDQAGYHTKECWVSFKDKTHYHSRSKISITAAFLDTPFNREILAQMKEKQNLIEEIENNIKDLKASLDTYKPEG